MLIHKIEYQIEKAKILFVSGRISMAKFEEMLSCLYKKLYSNSNKRLYEQFLK